MGTVLLKKERWIPPSVALAKAAGNVAELSRLGALGNKVKHERQQQRECQGVLPLTMKRQTSSGIRSPRKSHAPEQLAKVAETRYLNRLRRQEQAAIALADAESHADANRIGWDDALS